MQCFASALLSHASPRSAGADRFVPFPSAAWLVQAIARPFYPPRLRCCPFQAIQSRCSPLQIRCCSCRNYAVPFHRCSQPLHFYAVLRPSTPFRFSSLLPCAWRCWSVPFPAVAFHFRSRRFWPLPMQSTAELFHRFTEQFHRFPSLYLALHYRPWLFISFASLFPSSLCHFIAAHTVTRPAVAIAMHPAASPGFAIAISPRSPAPR